MSSFRELYRADIARYGGKHVPYYTRVFLFLYRKATSVKYQPIKFLYKGLFRIWADRRGLEFSAIEQIGGGLYLGHVYNITINEKAKIGRNCNIHRGVVIGQTNRGDNKGAPTIGNEVWIGINAAIVGNITIGEDVLIAPNSFVNIDVPSHSVVFGNPCIIRHRDWATEGYINCISNLDE